MTVTFSPGDVNSPACVDHKQWKNHRVVVYGSGNSVIIHSVTATSSATSPSASLQTIYAERDVTAVAINSETGLICAAYGAELVLLRPVNEYMTIPKWSEAARFLPEATRGVETSNFQSPVPETKVSNSSSSNSSSSNSSSHVLGHVPEQVCCLRWAPTESELVVGTSKAIYLLYVVADYAEVAVSCRWQKSAPGPVGMVDISPDASKIITYNTNSLDHFAKVWMRITYGDNTLFELAYADHGTNSWVVDFKWRRRAVDKATAMNLQAMANIRDLRTFMPSFSGTEENCILYTVTSDHVLHVWATCDFNGHNYLKLWARLELDSKVANYTSCIVVETRDVGSDLVLVMGRSESCLVQISHLNHNPPNSVVFEEMARFATPTECLPRMGHVNTRTSLQPVERIRYKNSYVRCSDGVSQNGSIFFICSDAIKKTLRTIEFDVRDMHEPRLILEEKFSGHSKSVTKLFTSSTSYSGNIMLSVSRFANENFIWEPVPVKHGQTGQGSSQKSIAISKRFCINISRGGVNGCILSAVLINDILVSRSSRHHLAVTIETGGYISFWDCNGATMDEEDARLIERLDVKNEGERLDERPQAFFVEKVGGEYIVIAVYSVSLVKGWRLGSEGQGSGLGSGQKVSEVIDSKVLDSKVLDSKVLDSQGIDSRSGLPPSPKSLSSSHHFFIHSINCSPFPGNYGACPKVSNLSTYFEKELSVIDDNGLLRLLAVDYSDGIVKWKESCKINTNIQNPTFIHGASVIGKVAIINDLQLTIWDCTSGVLEYSETFTAALGPVRDLDWTFMGDTKSTTKAILSVGFARSVLLYTQVRYDYTNRIPTFAVVKKIDISNYTDHEIGDSIWLDDHYLVISSGNQFFIEDGRITIGNARSPIDSTVQELLLGFQGERKGEIEEGGWSEGMEKDSKMIEKDSKMMEKESKMIEKESKMMEKESKMTGIEMILPLEDVVRILNGPLPLYHPQFLIQALLMDQVPLVKIILIRLLSFLRNDTPISWNLGLQAKDILDAGTPPPNEPDSDIFSSFSDVVVDLLLQKLASISLPLITRHQQSTLSNVVKVVSHAEQYRASLDANGLKFVYSFELFQSSRKKKSLNMRDISWALHSDQKEMLFGLLEKVYARMSWATICTTGIVYWVDRFRLEKTLECVARNEFADSRDPSARVAVLYLALRKKQVLLGLWKTVSHAEKTKMLSFLSNDFGQQRWKSAAAKNAFVLLGKHRYLDSAAFFLLAGQISDCCMILCNKMQDTDLALAVARVNNDLACVQTIIEQYVLPGAVERGDRWMTSWAFWQMKKKAWSIQALLHTPHACVQDHLSEFSSRFQTDFNAMKFVPESASFLRDDPVLGVLYSNLRQAKSSYHEGAKEVSAQTEFDFVIKLANIYSRMGCDYLSMMLLTRWRFLAEKKDESEPNEAFSDFSARKNMAAVTHDAAFAEPDMSAFDFGF